MEQKKQQAYSLSQATTTARRAVAGCLVFIIAILVFQNFRGFLSQGPTIIGTEGCAFKPVAEGFGDLPEFKIDSLPLAEGVNPGYSVATGGFGDLSPYLKTCVSKGANVYKVKTPRETFGIVERAETIAEKLGFTETYKKTSDHDLEWNAADKKLNFNKVFKSWKYEVNLQKDSLAGKHKLQGDEIKFTDNAISLVSGLGVTNLDESKLLTEVYYFTLKDGKLTQTASPTSAQYVQVNFYIQKEALTPLDTVIKSGIQTENPATAIIGKVYTPEPEFGSLSVLFSDNGKNGIQLYAFEYTQWDVETKSSVYEIISVQEAWTKISNGEGQLRYLKKQGDSVLSEHQPLKVQRFISENDKVSIGYFEDPTFFKNSEKEEFLLPIYIFEGTAELEGGAKADFVYYIDALKR